MTAPIIETPQGRIIMVAGCAAKIEWNADFKSKWQGQYYDAQRFVDSEVLRLSEPFIPLLTGTLVRTGILGTEIGSGTVHWIAPYAKQQYYKGRQPGRSGTGPLRGAFWFERMKEVHGDKIIAGARRIASGKQ